jgi:hypothetical protein
MKIYRGPSQKDFSDDTHQKVSEVDLSADYSPWTERRLFRGNITKDGFERKAVTHVELGEADIIALHRGLVEGLQRQAEQTKTLQLSVKSLREALEEIQRIILLASHHGEAEAIAKIKTRTERALNPKKRVVLIPVKK